jgi:hypothetical protein
MIFSYDGNKFDNLNNGLQTHDTTYASKAIAICSTPYKGKTLIAGSFQSVGSPFKYSPMIASWDGANWDTLEKSVYKNVLNNKSYYVNGFYKAYNKLFIFGAFDSIAGIPGKNIYSFDGINYKLVNIPVNNNVRVNSVVLYKDTLYIAGLFFNFPSYDINKLIKFDGQNFYPVKNGILGGLAGIGQMVVYKDTLYLAGAMNKADGNAGNHIVKWDGSKFLDAGFGNFYDWGGINQLLVFKNRLYAFGRFTYATNKKAYGAAYYENGKWTVNTDSIDNNINNAVVFNDTIYIAGGFSSINADTSLKYFVKLKCPDFDGCKKSTLSENLNSPFPNPCTNKLTINLPNEVQSNITIISSLGQLISKQTLSGKVNINTSIWANGIYLIQISNNYLNKTFKIIKE